MIQRPTSMWRACSVCGLLVPGPITETIVREECNWPWPRTPFLSKYARIWDGLVSFSLEQSRWSYLSKTSLPLNPILLMPRTAAFWNSRRESEDLGPLPGPAIGMRKDIVRRTDKVSLGTRLAVNLPGSSKAALPAARTGSTWLIEFASGSVCDT